MPNIYFSTTKQKELDEVLLADVDNAENHELIVWNDNVNSFDHVIQTLIEVCKHNTTQAEQCTMLIHYKGKCAVKKGSFDYLRPMAEAIIDRGIQATVD
jgi:ATP-dependent Clp protease adaptor protein ClpS